MTRKVFVEELNTYLTKEQFQSLEQNGDRVWSRKTQVAGPVQVVSINGRQQVFQSQGPILEHKISLVGNAAMGKVQGCQVLVEVFQNEQKVVEFEEIFLCTKEGLKNLTDTIYTLLYGKSNTK